MADKTDLLPEEKARVKIDRWLTEVGWTVVSRDEYTDAINAQAVKENLMLGNREADYMLFLAGKAIAVLETKREENPLGDDVKAQAENYTRILPPTNQYWFSPIPFVFISNGETLLFKDMRESDSDYINLGKMYSPKELVERAGIKDDFAMLPAVPPVAENALRECQHEAITNVELSFKRGVNRCLLDLATGSGKTFTACMLSYRAISYTPVQRILYLVDRNNLGKQTEDEFKSFKLTETGQTFTSIYSVIRLKKAEEAKGANVCISSIQRLFAVLTGQNFTDTDDDADDQNDEETFFDEQDDGTQVELGNDVLLPKDFFQLIIVDECHRSIYGKWRKVIEYFDKAKIIGLTATPTPQAYAFFQCHEHANGKYEPTFQYSVDESYIAGINVPPRIYRIKTEVSENGGEIKDKEKIFEVNRRTGEKVSVEQEQNQNYTKTDVDRSVVNPTQIKRIVEEYRDIIYTKLFTNREPQWEYIPKTLFFAKTDKHADLIISIIETAFKEKFDGGKIPDHFVQKITCKAGNTNQLIKDFRNEKDFRIAVTVTLVATGTDVKPLEVLVFMRDIHSSVLYTQMKGRGCRKIDDDMLRLVTPNADTKENFILIDAVGVTESEKKIPQATDGENGDDKGQKLTLEKVLEWLSHGDVRDENLQFLAEKLAFINKKTEEKHKAEFETLTKISMKNLALAIFKAFEADLPEFTDINEPNNERKTLVSVLIDNPQARQLLLNLEAGFYKILRPGKDEITYSGFSLMDSENYTKQFEEYVNLHCDDIEALKIIYNDEEKAITNAMLLDLKDKIIALNPLFSDFAVVWEAYHTLSVNQKIAKKVLPLKEKSERETLTNLIQLVRFAYGKTETLQAINGIIAQRFGLYIGQHLGNQKRNFSNEQIEVLKTLAEYVAQKGCVTRQDFHADGKNNLFMNLVKIYTLPKLDEELDYFSKFLLQIKAA